VIYGFFFQAEDGIRDRTVTGVQTCALPIFDARSRQPFLERHLELTQRYIACFPARENPYDILLDDSEEGLTTARVEAVFKPLKQIGRASCRERGENAVGSRSGEERRTVRGE